MSIIDMRNTDRARNGLIELCKFIPSHCCMVEIGSYAGASTEIFLDNVIFDEFHCVDAWTSGYDDNDKASSSDMTEVEAAFDKIANEHIETVVKHKGWSNNMVYAFEDNSIDVLYIDGGHSYESLKEDITLWLPKIKKDGIIAGHDWNVGWPGVTKAVRELLGKPEHTFEDGSWLFYIKNLY